MKRNKKINSILIYQLCGVVLVIDFTGWKISDVQLLNKQHLADAVHMFQVSLQYSNSTYFVRSIYPLVFSLYLKSTDSVHMYQIFLHYAITTYLMQFICCDVL